MPQSLIVFSHLRWDFVLQRPQHLMSRLAQHYRIFFFEEPVTSTGSPHLEVSEPVSNIKVCRPHTPCEAPGFHDAQIPLLQELLSQLLKIEQLTDYLAWFYSPMALPLMNHLKPLAVIYDCMDELSAFQNAPMQMIQRENALLKEADLVFTGGPSLYRAKRHRHASVHCFTSSVDADHFRGALTGVDHPLQRDLARPRLGFFGVIDERIDHRLLQDVANAQPHWQVVMVGPCVKVEPQRLARAANIHYFGLRPYAELPAFLAGWDVCLQPFALNEATQFISPTKTLEYMAAQRPIVSTPITDVVEPYRDVISVAKESGDFIAACKSALSESTGERENRLSASQTILTRTSWNQTASQMHALIEQTLARRSHLSAVVTAPHAAAAPCSPLSEVRRTSSPLRSEYLAIVIGAGPTGLSAGYHLGKGSLVLEKESNVGGWCRSIEAGGFTFDYAGHIMFSNDPYVQELYRRLLGDNVHWQDREAWIYSKSVYTRYPFQGALYGLPPDVLKDCIVGAIEARFGPLRGLTLPGLSAANASSVSSCKAESVTDCCADGVAEGALSSVADIPRGFSPTEPRNFEEFIYKTWGAGVARHFAIPYNQKLWAVPLAEMETSWLGGRVPLPDLDEMIDGALRPVPRPQGPNARFGYPLRGGFQSLVNGFVPLMKGDLLTGAQVVRIDSAAHVVELADGRSFNYQRLISTAPLPQLLRLLGDLVPSAIRAAGEKLRHVSVRCVNLGVSRENISNKHWIYYPEDSVFHRVFLQGNASPFCNAPGGFALTCEITYSPQKPLPCEGDALTDRCIADCERVGLLRADDVIPTRNQVDMPYAYVVYDHHRRQSVTVIREWLKTLDIELAGRYSEWEYYNSDHAFVAGQRAAELVLGIQRPETAAEAR